MERPLLVRDRDSRFALDRAAAMLVHMEIEPRRKRPWSPWQYMVLVVIALLIAVFCLGPLGRLVISPFQAISSALSGQQR